mmetsp:Transcript_17693/g.38420  ORF Transcript_17693/g.38420 Transcript_17693/m.38420 type:complete len:254 (-) Transcript_17693:247-1008(-)
MRWTRQTTRCCTVERVSFSRVSGTTDSSPDGVGNTTSTPHHGCAFPCRTWSVSGRGSCNRDETRDSDIPQRRTKMKTCHVAPFDSRGGARSISVPHTDTLVCCWHSCRCLGWWRQRATPALRYNSSSTVCSLWRGKRWINTGPFSEVFGFTLPLAAVVAVWYTGAMAHRGRSSSSPPPPRCSKIPLTPRRMMFLVAITQRQCALARLCGDMGCCERAQGVVTVWWEMPTRCSVSGASPNAKHTSEERSSWPRS